MAQVCSKARGSALTVRDTTPDSRERTSRTTTRRAKRATSRASRSTDKGRRRATVRDITPTRARPQTGYRPRYNANQGEGGYQPRQSQYGQRPQTGYRPRYNANQGEGGYQPRQQGYQRGGYQRNQYGQPRQGGYNRQGGYRQRTPDYDPNAKYSLKKRIEYKEEHIDPTVPVRLNKPVFTDTANSFEAIDVLRIKA